MGLKLNTRLRASLPSSLLFLKVTLGMWTSADACLTPLPFANELWQKQICVADVLNLLPSTHFSVLTVYISFFRLFRADECSARTSSSPSYGWHGGPPIGHQHLQADPVPHVQLGPADERAGLSVSRHHVVSGIALCVAAVHPQHELPTAQQSTGEGTWKNPQISVVEPPKETFRMEIVRFEVRNGAKFSFFLWYDPQVLHSLANLHLFILGDFSIMQELYSETFALCHFFFLYPPADL